MPTGILDQFTGFTIGISGDHAYIHKGKGYVINGVTASLASGASESISFKTPAATTGKMIHFRPTRVSSRANSASVTMIEGAVTTSGTKQTPQNLNRNKPNASLVDVYTGATISVAGTGGTIYYSEVGSGGASDRGGGSDGSNEERVLKPDTTYSITFTNTGAATASVSSYTLFWYEE